MSHTRNLITLVFIPMLMFALPVTGYADKDAGEGKQKHSMEKQQKSKGARHFTPHWAKTLTDAQKLKVDKMHLELDRTMYQLRAEKKLRQAELNSLAAQDDPDEQAIKRKIDEVLELKRQIMQARYDHLVAMRAVLTKEQRISYDMAVLGRAGVAGKGH